MTVEELLTRTSARELAEWEAFFRLEAGVEAGGGGGKVSDTADVVAAFRRMARGHNRKP